MVPFRRINRIDSETVNEGSRVVRARFHRINLRGSLPHLPFLLPKMVVFFLLVLVATVVADGFNWTALKPPTNPGNYRRLPQAAEYGPVRISLARTRSDFSATFPRRSTPTRSSRSFGRRASSWSSSRPSPPATTPSPPTYCPSSTRWTTTRNSSSRLDEGFSWP